MSSTPEEMRRVIGLASEKLTKARQGDGLQNDRLRRLEIASAYASGVLDLLATYLEVTDQSTPAPAPDRSHRNRAPDGRFLPTANGASS